MPRCIITGKGNLTGNRRSHALNATKRTWKVNLQPVKLQLEDGTVIKTRVSARGLKTLRKTERLSSNK
ncbi:MAG: 50S ribosomal protein L28 [Acholeplasmatales bacterium]|jgi:large subunit ribosomal protein L28|nr:50S ribosomal protein L28 [Acholeplasmatales bacterium]